MMRELGMPTKDRVHKGVMFNAGEWSAALQEARGYDDQAEVMLAAIVHGD